MRGSPCVRTRCCGISARSATWLIWARAIKGFFDTAVLVAVFYEDHVHHEPSLALFIQFDKSTGLWSAQPGRVVLCPFGEPA